MRSLHRPISFLRTPSTMTGLQVAPTAPCSIEYVSSWMEAESFHREEGVDCVISCNGLLYTTGAVIWVMGSSGRHWRFACLTGEAAWFGLPMRILRRHRDLEGPQA